jgi:hypothetical protein
MVRNVRQRLLHIPHLLFPKSLDAGAESRRQRFRPKVEVLERRLLPSTYTVTDLGDDGAGSGRSGDLRYCINAANTNAKASNRIVFQAGLTGTIALVRGEFDVTKRLEIDGPGADQLTISGNHHGGVFALTNDPRLQSFRLADLTVADGTGVLHPFFGNFHAGGGLYDYNPTATVALTRCAFSGNAVSGPVDFGGAVATTSGTLLMEGCVLSGNNGGLEGGALAVGGQITLSNCLISGNVAREDSAILNHGTLTLDHCTVAQNAADTTGGYTGDTIANSGGQTLTIQSSQVEGNVGSVAAVDNIGGRMVLTDSTIPDNIGGGIRNAGSMALTGCTISGNVDTTSFAGGIFITDVGTGSDTSLTNCTISGNTSNLAVGGIRLFRFQDSVELTSCTVTGNAAPFAGGIMVLHNDQTGNSALAVVRNTIIAGNEGSFPDVMGPVVSLGHNLIGQTDGSSGWRATDLTGTSQNPLDAQLSPLQDNGGPTLTHAPTFTSPAHQHGDFALFGSLDQRGSARDDLIVPPDIGAVNSSQALHLVVQAPDQAAPGEPFDVTVVALDNWGNRAFTYQGNVHFTSSDPAAQLPANYRFRPTDWGAQSFTVTLNTAGSQVVTVTDTLGFPSGTVTVDVQGEGPPSPSPRARGGAIDFGAILGALDGLTWDLLADHARHFHASSVSR